MIIEMKILQLLCQFFIFYLYYAANRIFYFLKERKNNSKTRKNIFQISNKFVIVKSMYEFL